MLNVVILTLVIVSCVVALPQVSRVNNELDSELTERNGRIVGGRDATIEEFPFMVSLLVINDHFCGGSILNANTILTAAICTLGNHSAYSVRAGSSMVREGGQVVPVSKVIEHELYNGRDSFNNIAIMKLATNLVFSASVRATVLPLDNFVVPHGTIATITGWGALEVLDPNVSPILKAVVLPIVGNQQCGAIKNVFIPSIQMCAGGEAGRGSCISDNGGPLVFQGAVVGIIIRGNECNSTIPLVHTRVARFLPFITQNML